MAGRLKCYLLTNGIIKNSPKLSIWLMSPCQRRQDMGSKRLIRIPFSRAYLPAVPVLPRSVQSLEMNNFHP